MTRVGRAVPAADTFEIALCNFRVGVTAIAGAF
jgi:hypothetical protein